MPCKTARHVCHLIYYSPMNTSMDGSMNIIYDFMNKIQKVKGCLLRTFLFVNIVRNFCQFFFKVLKRLFRNFFDNSR
jgi:hypothetical protein